MTSIDATTKVVVKKKVPAVGVKKKKAGAPRAPKRRASIAPLLKPSTLSTTAAIEKFLSLNESDRKNKIEDLFRKALGEQSALNISAPHAASTTRDRGGAAADVAVIAKELGISFILVKCKILDVLQKLLLPRGIEELLNCDSDNNSSSGGGGGLKPSSSAVSLSSLVSDDGTDITPNSFTTANSAGTDSRRGKSAPNNAREGCLLFIRALCEIVGKKAEPFLVGAFLVAALDECASSSSAVREAAEDTSTAIVALAHPWAFPSILFPILLSSVRSSEWRVKAAALERLQQCSTTSVMQVQKMIPTLIPVVTNQVWDTKAQVSNAARDALLSICETNTNKDIKATIPYVVNAICKPSDTNKAVSELMGTTFVVPVDASTLAILCPVLARALKEKLAIHKRAACIVISNMSKLVESPEAVAPFGSLLVPELTKVTQNVQFEEIRDEALKALANLTKALGDSFSITDENKVREMEAEQAHVEEEQNRIKEQREAEAKREEELAKKEEAERKKFKEAMEAQRQLDLLAKKEAEEKRKKEEQKREVAKRSTKGSTGKCQACGLKKCPKSCMFYSKKK